MSGGLTSWIGPVIIRHDQRYGANLNATQRGTWYGQIIKFTSFRSVDKPDDHTQIAGVIGDAHHHIRVTFEVDATDRFEQPEHGLTPRRLTSLLRHNLLIREFRINIASSSPTKATSENPPHTPDVSLHILDFDDHSGSIDSPEHYDTMALGHGPNDGDIKNILRKWWLGESESNPHDEPLHAATVEKKDTPQREHLTWRGILDQHIQNTAKKPIPDYIFNISDSQRQALDEIEMFGMEMEETSQEAEDSGKQTSFFVSPEEAQPSGEASMTIPQRTAFDSLLPIDDSSQPSQSTSPREFSDQSDEELIDGSDVGSDALSDYEREQRRLQKGKGKAASDTQPKEGSLAPSTYDEGFSLSRYAKLPDTTQEVLVSDSDKARKTESESLSQSLGETRVITQSAPQASPANERKRSRSPSPQQSRIPSSTRPITVDSYEERTALSLKVKRTDETASQRQSVLSLLNPMPFFRSLSGHSRTRKPPSSPVQSKRRAESSDESLDKETQFQQFWAGSHPVVGSQEKSQDDQAGPAAALDHSANHLSEAALHPPTLVTAIDSQHSLVSLAPSQMSLSDLMPMEADLPPPRPKLGGFRPDLTHPDLLTNRDIATALAKAEISLAQAEIRRARFSKVGEPS